MADGAAKRPRAVLLDLGGVLIHVHFDRALDRWTRAAGLADGALCGRFVADDAYRRHERGEMDFAGYAASLRRRLGVELDEAELLQGWNAALGEAMAGARELVARLAAAGPVYLFSNSNAAHHACWSRHHAGLLEPLHGVFVSHRVGARKPEVEAFRRVVSAIGVPAHQVAFFDDLAENVVGARRAGLHAFQVGRPADVARALGLDP